MSATTQPLLKGITAQAMKATITLTSGATKKITLLAPDGTITSLSRNLTASAMVWSRPNGPTTLGPRRICTAAQILRSANITAATDSIKTRQMTKMNTDWPRNQAQP